MNTMSPVAELPEATENATHAAPDALPANDAPQAPAPEADAHDADTASAPAAAGAEVQSPRALLKHLQQQFKAFRDCLPLAIGIDKQVLARLPGLNRKTMRAALGIHTGSMRYLRAMEKATLRYDLDGNPGAEVTDTHRQHAKELLQERFKKEAERKKAERDAAAQAESDRKRQEKLQQLASKFAKR
ncbi:ProQ/FinO family protein [Massilia luteola]|uniref:ProQ/FinO family protein n=1 Tax=Massilia luteola TaxID=3081751 RepID=UPI002ACBE5D3|nr:ProQ/FinO family protein [Massilia sp. Gc5]